MERLATRVEEKKENLWSGLYYHHARPVEHCSVGVVTQEKEEDFMLDSPYRWIESEVGFYPLFIAVGDTEQDMLQTGYKYQPAKSNYALFSFKVLEGVFIDQDVWHSNLNFTDLKMDPASDRSKKRIFKPSWGKSDWLRMARQMPGSVQMVVSSLDLGKADLVSVRNQPAKRLLEQRGFRNVQVRRLIAT